MCYPCRHVWTIEPGHNRSSLTMLTLTFFHLWMAPWKMDLSTMLLRLIVDHAERILVMIVLIEIFFSTF
jgi:hypothetical protein